MLDYDIKPFEVCEQFKIDKFYTMFNFVLNRSAGESHDFWECIYIRRGNICSCIDRKVYRAKSGDFIICKPMEFHQAYTEGSEDAELFVFSFSMKIFPKDFAQHAIYSLTPSQQKTMRKIIDYAQNASLNYPYSDDEVTTQEKEYINFKFVKTLLALAKNPCDIARIRNYIYELFFSLNNSDNAVEETDSFHAGIYRKAVRYMTDNISSKISVADIAKYCCTSETTLKGIFHQFSGMSIHKVFVKLKINQAIILLKSEISATDVSKQLGFSSQAYFSAAFKRETGLTPRDYLSRFGD